MGAAAVLAPPQVPPKSPEVESPEVEFLEDAAALTDGEEDDGEETEDLGSGVQKKPWRAGALQSGSVPRAPGSPPARHSERAPPPRPPDEVPTLPTRGQR